MPPKEHDNLQEVTLSVMNTAFHINAFGPTLLTQALLPNILASKATKRHVAVMSSRVGSIADNTSGGYLAYRKSSSQAGLRNQW
jgi:short-subunit dehydrogenase